jgi:hypothetical protein
MHCQTYDAIWRKENDKFASGLEGRMPFKGVGVGSKVVQQLVGGRGDERSCHQDQHLHTDGHICHILSLDKHGHQPITPS